jgi:tetratricopeptide (TPR) repeat protein
MNTVLPEQSNFVTSSNANDQWAAALAAAQQQIPPATVTQRQTPVVTRAGLLGMCLAGGLVGGMAVQSRLQSPAPDEQPAASEPTASKVTPSPDGLSGGIDTLIRAGCFREALSLYSTQPQTPHDDTARAFREGLCFEGLRQWEHAAEAYRRATNTQLPWERWAWATFGQVRCALGNNQREVATDLLNHFCERLKRQPSVELRILSECLHLQARLLLMDLDPSNEFDPLASNATAIAWPPLTGNVEQYLGWFELDERLPEQGFIENVTNQVLVHQVMAKHPPSWEAAARLLRLAVMAADDHPAERAIWVTLGNIYFQIGRFNDANRSYRKVQDRLGFAPEAVYAAYNLGLLELRQSNFHAAQARFLEVIDRAPATHWADYSWWWLARTHLDAGDFALARQPLQTALAGRTKEVASAAVLAICACHLLDGDSISARVLLQNHRISNRESHIVLLELFEATLRYRAAPSELRADAVLSAIPPAQQARALGPLGVFLTGQIYSELNQHEKMIHLYDDEAIRIHGQLAVRMTFEAARRFDQLDLRYQARQRYLAVTVMDPEGFGPLAQLRVADLAGRDGRGVECVQRCRKLIDRPGIERAELLAIMGHGYELQKKYRQAAECFAGQVPRD